MNMSQLIALILVACLSLILLVGTGFSQAYQPDSTVDFVFQTSNENPGLDSALNQLIETYTVGGTAAAESFSERHRLDVQDGVVQVTVLADPEQPDIGAVIAEVEQVGGVVQTWWGDQVQALAPVNSLEWLAAQDAILYIRQPLRPALDVTTEGDVAINANTYRAQLGTDGAGVKVAVLDLGFSGYPALQTSGELPSGATVQSFRSDAVIDGVTDHGTACAEIIHDLAPGASYYFVNYGTDTEFYNAVGYLESEGVQVVSHSVSFFNAGPYDGNSSISQRIELARGNNILWSNSAGNRGQQHWEGMYEGDASDWHVWDGASANVNQIGYLPANTLVTAYLSWNDWPLSSNNYDLFLVGWSESSNDWEPLAWSTGIQNGFQPPIEEIHFEIRDSTNYGLVVANPNGAAAPLYLELFTTHQDLQFPIPDGSISNGGDSTGALTVGAVNVVDYSASGLELFSGRGPTNALGGGAPAYGAGSLTKPDIVAPDNTSTVTYPSFSGTSASAPHAAGAAVLYAGGYLGAYGSLPTADQIQAYLENCAETALDWGVDTDGIKNNHFGAGGLYMCQTPTAIKLHAFGVQSPDISILVPLALLFLAGLFLVLLIVVRGRKA